MKEGCKIVKLNQWFFFFFFPLVWQISHHLKIGWDWTKYIYFGFAHRKNKVNNVHHFLLMNILFITESYICFSDPWKKSKLNQIEISETEQMVASFYLITVVRYRWFSLQPFLRMEGLQNSRFITLLQSILELDFAIPSNGTFLYEWTIKNSLKLESQLSLPNPCLASKFLGTISSFTKYCSQRQCSGLVQG